LRAGDLVREVAMIVPTSEAGNERRCDVSASPRPREHPVMRYEAIEALEKDENNGENLSSLPLMHLTSFTQRYLDYKKDVFEVLCFYSRLQVETNFTD
jgi:hypothetical protein